MEKVTGNIEKIYNGWAIFSYQNYSQYDNYPSQAELEQVHSQRQHNYETHSEEFAESKMEKVDILEK